VLPQDLAQDLWLVQIDRSNGYQISYPNYWKKLRLESPDEMFVFGPDDQAGHCRGNKKVGPMMPGLEQKEINVLAEAMPIDANSWSNHLGLDEPSMHLIRTGYRKAGMVSAIYSVYEAQLSPGLFEKSAIAMAFTSDALWALKCEVLADTKQEAEVSYSKLEPKFDRIFESFVIEPHK
jgi:hypothetical protein